MKSPIQLGLSLFGILFLLSSCSTWHYKHARVKIDADDAITVEEPSPVAPLTIVANSETAPQQAEMDQSADISSPLKEQIKIAPGSNRLQHKDQSKSSGYFVQKFNQGKHLFKVNEVEKTQLANWLKIMIILFAVGLILLILGAIFSAVIFGGFWWFFYLFGSLCILAGCIVLVLGLVGVMH